MAEGLTEKGWLSRHPYLEPLARVHAEIDAALVGQHEASAAAIRWEDYRHEFAQGIPLLRSQSVTLDLSPANRTIAGLVERVSLAGIETLRSDVRGHDVAAWLLGDDAFEPSSPGLARFLGWTALARWLRPVRDAFASWRDENRWMRRYCPTCGSSPAMGRLAAGESGRERYLACGCCKTRWRFPRTECPFCEAEAERSPAMTVEGEAGLRLDYCDSCRAYLKTYDGKGAEALMLSDWTSLHLDVLAQERGLTRAAASLYDLAPAHA